MLNPEVFYKLAMIKSTREPQTPLESVHDTNIAKTKIDASPISPLRAPGTFIRGLGKALKLYESKVKNETTNNINYIDKKMSHFHDNNELAVPLQKIIKKFGPMSHSETIKDNLTKHISKLSIRKERREGLSLEKIYCGDKNNKTLNIIPSKNESKSLIESRCSLQLKKQQLQNGDVQLDKPFSLHICKADERRSSIDIKVNTNIYKQANLDFSPKITSFGRESKHLFNCAIKELANKDSPKIPDLSQSLDDISRPSDISYNQIAGENTNEIKNSSLRKDKKK